ncbi:TetR family transcriptional regulator [Pseudomonas sp. NFX98]|uniref:TetR family transcriptional regulator n=1 Tax=Pseudomonas sp. NFX98 TaxID=3399122 RepID=UPI0039FCC445
MYKASTAPAHNSAMAPSSASSNECRSLVPDSRYEMTRKAAVELFARRGFSNVSMRDLAVQIGISPGSIYNHTESKEALLFELIESIYLDLLSLVPKQRKNQSEPGSALINLIKKHVHLHEKKSWYFWLAEHEAGCLSPANHEKTLKLRQRYETHFARLLSHLLREESEAVQLAIPPVLVGILNNLPAWLKLCPLSRDQRSQLIVDMALGAVYATLSKQGASRFSQLIPKSADSAK